MFKSPGMKREDLSNSRKVSAIEDRTLMPNKLDQNLHSAYDMWGLIFPEIATIRMEVSRLGSLVRRNDISSPNYLDAFLVQMKALLQSIGLVSSTGWARMDKEYKQIRRDIEEYNKQRRGVPNKRIPTELIDRLDEYYRACLMLAQFHGLGIKIAENIDVDKALESAFTK